MENMYFVIENPHLTMSLLKHMKIHKEMPLLHRITIRLEPYFSLPEGCASISQMAYIIKARMQLMRDFGCYPAAHSAFLLNMGVETLSVRMKQYCENAQVVAEYLEKCDMVESVRYPGLKNDPCYELGRKYLKGCKQPDV